MTIRVTLALGMGRGISASQKYAEGYQRLQDN